MPPKQKPDSAKPVIMGRFGGAFGIKGWIKVQSFTDPPAGLSSYSPWLIEEEGDWRSLVVTECRAHKSSFIAKIEHINDRNAATKLTGQQIAVVRSALPPLPDGEYYLQDLLGLTVETRTGKQIGSVIHAMDSKVHDVLVVRADSGEDHLIPWLPEQGVIQTVSLAERRIIVDWDTDY